MPSIDEPVSLSLQQDQEQTLPGTELRLWISSSSSKHGAPVSSVSVMFALADVLAERSWTIEEGRFSSEWLAVEGRFWHPQLERYEEGALPGWQVRLDSVDETSVSGAPTAVTVSVRRHSVPEAAP
ncbi:MAG: hypothetical protein RBU37_10070 [Myxococcota bacterium]|jgi:hypothetical protein|nr:hypothetical protein [Myxococcota bacterium]